MNTFASNGREAPHDPPPAYSRVTARLPARSISPIIIILNAIGCLWALVVGGSYLRGLSDAGETTKLKITDIVYGVLCLVAACTLAFGVIAACMNRLSMVKLYHKISIFNVLLIVAIGIIRIVFHFTTKSDLIAQCVINNQGDLDINGNPVSSSNITDYCNSQFNRSTWIDILWLIGLILFAFFGLSLAAAYYHQAKNPANYRMSGAPSAAYRMNPYASDPPFQAPFYPPQQAPDYKNGPPEYQYEQYQGNLADKGAETPGYQTDTPNTFLPPSHPPPQQQGYSTNYPADSTDTLRAVDLNDNDGDLSSHANSNRRHQDTVV